MTFFTKYFLLQVPGWGIMALALLGLREWFGLSIGLVLGILFIWVAKDLFLYPFIRSAYEPGVKTGIETLIGDRGIAWERLAPGGYVKVRGELWRAELENGHEPIPPGTPIQVQDTREFSLIVRRKE